MAWELVKHTRTGAGLFYIGQAEVATFDIGPLPPDWLPGHEWLARNLTDALIQSAAGEGVILDTKVYRDCSLIECNYRVVVAAHASPLAWSAIIIAALIVIGLGLVAWILQSVVEQPWLGVGLVAVGIGAGALGIGYLLRSRPAKGGT